jgi:hypothetical protein
MTYWRPQPFRTAAKAQGRDANVIAHAVATAQSLTKITPAAEPIFSLRHLAHLTSAPYAVLRGIVRRDTPAPYRVFKIHKRPLSGEPVRFRTIVVPDRTLMTLQRWLNANVLNHVTPHRASVAFSTGDSIRKAAERHCGVRWLIKMDLRNFFESVTERQIYEVFRGIGYQPLVAFELARLCTRVAPSHWHLERYQAPWGWDTIEPYWKPLMGHLPQGAPTSPRLANLAARGLDEGLDGLAEAHGFTYSRYADDLSFSTQGSFSRAAARSLIGEISAKIGNAGFAPNEAKTTVVPPGARKTVLGLLVDGDEPRLPREFKARLRQHLYYMKRHGPAAHATRKGNATVFGLRRHVVGLIQHARQIEPAYGDAQLERFNNIAW